MKTHVINMSFMLCNDYTNDNFNFSTADKFTVLLSHDDKDDKQLTRLDV